MSEKILKSATDPKPPVTTVEPIHPAISMDSQIILKSIDGFQKSFSAEISRLIGLMNTYYERLLAAEKKIEDLEKENTTLKKMMERQE